MTEPIEPARIDVTTNRKAKKWSSQATLARIGWMVLRPFFALSPRQIWVWRRMVLRCAGAKIGKNVHIYPTVKIVMPWNIRIDDDAAVGDQAILYALGEISIGARATVSQYVHVCAGSHDYKSLTMELQKTPIEIAPDSWVCADAFIGPGVVIGDRTVVGARAVVTKSVSKDAIIVGNPAQVIGVRKLDVEGEV